MKHERTFFDEDANRRLPTIIFDGPDGGGKTTAISMLVEDPREIFLLRQGEYRDVSVEQLWTRNLACLLFDYGYDRAKIRVLDRGWQSDAVYSPVYRGHASRIRVAQERMLERVALAAGAVVVYCLPPYDVCHKAWRSRPHQELLKAEAQLKDVYDRYAQASIRDKLLPIELHPHRVTCGLPLVKYDWTSGHEPRDLVARAEIARGSWGLRIAADPSGKPWPGIGAFRLNFSTLIVAAVPGQTHPYVGDDESSTWLTMLLEKESIPEMNCYWVNVWNRDFGLTKPDFVSELRPRRTVALGTVAAGWCRAMQIEHVVAPSPAESRNPKHFAALWEFAE